MSSSPAVQSLERGLEILSFLNQRNGSTVAQVARGCSLARTTAFRILETLCDNGFLQRIGPDGSYSLTSKELSLSDGFDDQSWVSENARPHLKSLSAELVWPTLIAVPSGLAMVWRENTDRDSPLALDRYAKGLRVPIVGSATGLVYLAYCTDPERRSVLDAPYQGATSLEGVMHPDLEIERVRLQGYATYPGRWRDGAIAVPILNEGRFLASVAVRYLRAAVPDDMAAAKFYDQLRRCADAIAAEFRSRVDENNRVLGASKAQHIRLGNWEEPLYAVDKR